MYRLAEGIHSTHNQDGAIVLDVRRGRFLRLNRTGSTILELVRRAQTQFQIVESLSKDFDVGRELAQHDVVNFLRSLEQQGIIYQSSVE